MIKGFSRFQLDSLWRRVKCSWLKGKGTDALEKALYLEVAAVSQVVPRSAHMYE